LRVTDIRLAPGNILDVPGVDHLRTDAHGFQCGVRALPVNARAFHHHFIGAKRCRPLGQRTPIPFECTELPLFDKRRAVCLFDDRAGRNLRLMHIESDHTLVKRYQFHNHLRSNYNQGRKVVGA